MTTPHGRPSDDLLREVLTHRAEGSNSAAELVSDVLNSIEARPQVRSWWHWQVGAQRQLLPALLVIILLASAAIGFVLIAGGTVPIPESDAGDIAFVTGTYGWSDTSGVTVADRRIHTVGASGGRPALLAEVPGLEVPQVEGRLALRDGRSGPAVQWSPDARRIAFRVFNGAAGIYVMNADGTDLKLLVDLPQDDLTDSFALHTNHHPMAAGFAWSPDGAQIAFSYPYFAARSPVFLVDALTGELRNVTGDDPSRGASGMVAWSPDGSKIAFARRNDEFSSSLIVINADGTGERLLVQAEREGFNVGRIAWSPDGALIAFVREGGPNAGMLSGTTELLVIKADGNAVRRLAGPWSGGCCGLASPPEPLAWSPDGTRIAVVGDGAIWIAQIDGSGETKLADDGEIPSWSPNGSQLTFSRPGSPIPGAPSRVPAQHRIYVINADATGLRWIADGEYPVWAPSPGRDE